MRFLPTRVSVNINHLSLGVAGLALMTTAYSAYTSHESLVISRENEQLSLFYVFQEEYAAIASRFPARMLDPTFRPVPGSDEYGRLQSYWIFAYAEWFATTRLSRRSSHALWVRYYEPLVENAMDIPALRAVLVDMKHSYGARRPAWQEFYHEMDALAARDGVSLHE